MRRGHEGEPALLLGLRRRPARRHYAKLRGRERTLLLLLVCRELLLLLGVEWVLGDMLLLSMSMHVGHRSLRRMGNLSGPGLLLLYLQILEPRQRREEQFRNLRAPTGSRRRAHNRRRIRVALGRRGRVLLHRAQRAANRVLVISCGHREHPTALAPPAKRVLHKPKVYFGQLGVGRDKTNSPRICQRARQSVVDVPWVCSALRTVGTADLLPLLLVSLVGLLTVPAAAVPTACPIPRRGCWRGGAGPCRRLLRLRLCGLGLSLG